MPEKEYASKGVAGTGLGLGIAGTALGLLSNPNNNILGNLFGNNYNRQDVEKIADLRAENTLLKSQKYTDETAKGLQSQICDIRVENATKFGEVNTAIIKQGEQINCINQSSVLKDQIIDGKLAQVAQTATCGFSQLQQQLNCLQQIVNTNPFPPFPPYYPYPFPPVTPPTTETSTTTNTTQG